MQMFRRFSCAVFSRRFCAPAAQAQTHVINKSALDSGGPAARQPGPGRSRRHPVVPSAPGEGVEYCGQGGPSGDGAGGRVDPQGDDLRQAAPQARQVNQDLAGGATVVITTTTIILVLLVIILSSSCWSIVRVPGLGRRAVRGAAASSVSGAARACRSRRHLAVPVSPQSEALCGGAAAAMVMRYWGATGVYAESFAVAGRHARREAFAAPT